MLDRQSTGFVAHFLRAYPRRTALMVALLIVAGLAEGISVVTLLPLLELTVNGSAGQGSELSQAVARALGAFHLKPQLSVLLLVIVAAMTLKGLLLWTAMKQVGYTVARVAADLRLRLIRALMQAKWSYFTSHPTGYIANSISSEAHRAAWAYKEACLALAGVIQAAIYVLVVFLISWPVALIALAVGGGLALALRRFISMSRGAGFRQTEMMKSLVARLTELLPGLKPIKAMAREDNLSALVEHETEEYNRAERRAVLASETLTCFREPLIVLLMAAGLFGALTLGQLGFSAVLALAILAYRLMTTLSVIQSKYQVMTHGESAFWSLMGHISHAETEREPVPGNRPPPPLRDAIRLDRVSFQYDVQTVFQDVSLTIPAGAFTTLTGPSGAGKTTLVDLITGLLRPDRGQVLVDDVPLDVLDLEAWRKLIGYVPQQTLLFHDTIYRNVTLGDEDIGEEAVRDALEAAGAWSFVADLDEGMEHVVGERGARLSGGQGQRIMIARALVHRPRLLILDEATTGVDPQTEHDICKTLHSLLGDLTIVSISHQPAMRDAADVVYEVGGQRVRRVGTTALL